MDKYLLSNSETKSATKKICLYTKYLNLSTITEITYLIKFNDNFKKIMTELCQAIAEQMKSKAKEHDIKLETHHIRPGRDYKTLQMTQPLC